MSVKIIWTQWGLVRNNCPHDHISFTQNREDRIEETVITHGDSGHSIAQTIRNGAHVVCGDCGAYGEMISEEPQLTMKL